MTCNALFYRVIDTFRPTAPGDRDLAQRTHPGISSGWPRSCPGPTTACQAGFTLIEVLVALAITALAFGFAVPAISTSLGRTASVAAADRATTLAETLLARVGHDIPLLDGSAAGLDGDMTWAVTIAPWLDEGDAAQHGGVTLHRVVVTVTWPGIGQPQSQQLVSLRLTASQ